MNAGRRMLVRCVISAVIPLAVGCGGGRDAGGAQPKPAAPVASGTPSSPAQPMHWSGHVAAGKSMEVRTIAGTIKVTAATGDLGEIEAKVHDAGPGSAPIVHFTEDEHGVVARVDVHEHGCECDHDHERHDGGSVDFEVKVPAGVHLIARSVHGGIDVDGVSGPIDLHTVDGGIAIRSATSARARTVNGSVTASFSKPDLESDCELETVNGPVQVTLPAAANAELVASTLNGEIKVGFPFSSGAMDRRSTHGSIGHGGRELRLRTINGTIEVSRGS